MESCLFCKIIKGQLPTTKHYEDDDVLVIADIHPAAPIHLLVMPKRHVLDIIEADEVMLGQLLMVVKKLIKEKKITNHRIIANGRGAQFVEHLHIHVMGGVAKDRCL